MSFRLYIAPQHEALFASGVIDPDLIRDGPRLDFLLSFSRGALF